jgi:hypothetical protein
VIALVALIAFVYWLFASGTFFAIVRPLVEWYAQQIRLGPAAALS